MLLCTIQETEMVKARSAPHTHLLKTSETEINSNGVGKHQVQIRESISLFIYSRLNGAANGEFSLPAP
jgi:hypothetical protein